MELNASGLLEIVSEVGEVNPVGQNLVAGVAQVNGVTYLVTASVLPDSFSLNMLSNSGKSFTVSTTNGFTDLPGSNGLRLSTNLIRPIPKFQQVAIQRKLALEAGQAPVAQGGVTMQTGSYQVTTERDGDGNEFIPVA